MSDELNFTDPLAETEWTNFTRRTGGNKLRWLEQELRAAGIESQRNGSSWHAPILQVKRKDKAAAWEILTPVDDVPDDDPRYNEYPKW